MAIALAAMVVMLKVKNISEDASISVIFVVLAAISISLLGFFLKNLEKA
ncbi:MAG: hypothetical protein JXB26_16835 [Candidatus Aminicenantes bacterium]|nr:hypothetical protein [Candidatus Aminicenantes bacterium]